MQDISIASIGNNSAINRLPQTECHGILDDFSAVNETFKAIQHLSSGIDPGADAIPAEVYKAGGLLAMTGKQT